MLTEIKKKHGANKVKLNEETTKLYREEGVNPMSGCLWSFVPLPIMFALFGVIRQPITMMMGVAQSALDSGGVIYNKLVELGFDFDAVVNNLHLQLDQAQFISANWAEFVALGVENLRELSFNLGVINLGLQPDWTFLWNANTDWGNIDNWLPGLLLFLIPFVSGGSQFLAAGINRKISPPGAMDAAGGSAQAMIKFMPLMSVGFGFMLPAALGFYWTVGTLLQIIQDVWLTKKYTKILDAEDVVKNEQRKKREAELEVKRIESERRKAEGLAAQSKNTSKRKKQKGNRQEQIEKATEWEKKNAPPKEKKKDDKHEPGRVGNRRYARGRAYDPDRYKKKTKRKKVAREELNVEAEEWGDEDKATTELISGEQPHEDIVDENVFDDADDDEYEVGDDEDEESYGDNDDDDDDDEDYDEDDEDAEDEDDEDDEDDDEDDDEAPPIVRFDTTRFDT